MDIRSHTLDRIRRFFSGGLDIVELAGLLIIAFATTVAIWQEAAMAMIEAGKVTLADLLLMFLYLEVLAMIGQYFRSGHIPVRYPLYIAMVALARYLILDIKELTELRVMATAGAILLLTLAVLAIRYGHVKFPYREDQDQQERNGPHAHYVRCPPKGALSALRAACGR
ncbi:MAG: phosphate-starvation-inducible PsiE family protein [Rhodocyclales bacterium]|nr:phosphate-starvation-inducible PsiE family protein [Rhodocyclales bacterium]